MSVALARTGGKPSEGRVRPTSASTVADDAASTGSMLIDASPIDRAASRDRTGAAMNRSPELDPWMIDSTSRHVGDPSSIIDAERLATNVESDGIAGVSIHAASEPPEGSNSSTTTSSSADHAAASATAVVVVASPTSATMPTVRPQSPLALSAGSSAGSAVVSTIGSVSTTRTSSAAATIGAASAATSTESDWRPSALVGRDRQRHHDAVDHRRVGRGRSRTANPRQRRDHQLYRDPLAQSDGKCTFVDLDGDDGVARSDERAGLHGLRRDQRAGHETDLGVRADQRIEFVTGHQVDR